MKVGFISLGCSKNLVDTEMCIGLLKNKGLTIVNNENEAEMIIINTCGFIETAKEEAINTILEMAEYKKKKCKYLVVMGCLVQRYKKELEKEIPEVDLFISIDEYNNISQKIDNLINKKEKKNNILDYNERVITTGNRTAYLKIAEGCSNKCTYCAIPYIRGPFKSRKIEDIIEEANILAEKGIQELILVAQDTGRYGVDIYGKLELENLLKKLCKIEKIKWIRFLYTYPETITDSLIDVVKNNEKICNYFDIPIQHISNKVLKRMNRKTTGQDIEDLVCKLRNKIPDVVLRTTLIVGFPGETQEDFEELYEFVQNDRFDKLGVFTYSKEDGTPAMKLDNHIHHATKKSRYNKIMNIQKEISKQVLQERLGKVYEAIIENKTFDGKYYIARTYMDVPETDGVVYIKNNKEIQIGEFVDCKLTEVLEYDFYGEFV